MKRPYHLMTPTERLFARIEHSRHVEEKQRKTMERISNGHLPEHPDDDGRYSHALVFPVVWHWIKRLSEKGVCPNHRQVVEAILHDPENRNWPEKTVENMVSFFSQTKTVDEKYKELGKRNPYGSLIDQKQSDGCYVFTIINAAPTAS